MQHNAVVVRTWTVTRIVLKEIWMILRMYNEGIITEHFYELLAILFDCFLETDLQDRKMLKMFSRICKRKF